MGEVMWYAFEKKKIPYNTVLFGHLFSVFSNTVHYLQQIYIVSGTRIWTIPHLPPLFLGRLT